MAREHAPAPDPSPGPRARGRRRAPRVRRPGVERLEPRWLLSAGPDDGVNLDSLPAALPLILRPLDAPPDPGLFSLLGSGRSSMAYRVRDASPPFGDGNAPD